MRIAFVAAECAPWVKTGGLGDVISALPRELARQGMDVSVWIPFYRQVRDAVGASLPVAASIPVPFQHALRTVRILDGGRADGVQMYFADCPALFERDGVYGDARGDYPDNIVRYAALARATLAATKLLGVPDIFHVHDWQGALLPVFLREHYGHDTELSAARTVLTIHNAAYQGWFLPRAVEELLLPWSVFVPERLEAHGTFDCLKGGVNFSDYLTTVSPRYAEQIKQDEFGEGLEWFFQQRSGELRGILNGIDEAVWDPKTDTHLAGPYSILDMSGKAACRTAMLEEFGLPQVSPRTPVLGIVSRLVAQKGLDILDRALDYMLAEDCVLLVLGAGEARYESMLRGMALRYPGRVKVRIGFDEGLAHRIVAGADIFLMPSRYEPCGLGQMHAMRYGTVPLVHATGGLADTVDAWNPESLTGTGFRFESPAPYEMLLALRSALKTFRSREAWMRLQRNGMNKDFGWAAPAREYIEVYEHVAKRGR